MMDEDNQIVNSSGPNINDTITDSINAVLSQINNEVTTDGKNKKKNKRTASSINDSEDSSQKNKRSSYIEIKEISDTERIINFMIERLDHLEEENSRLCGLNEIITKEHKEIKNNYIKLNTKHTNLQLNLSIH